MYQWMNQYIRTSKHKSKNFTCNEWMYEWISTSEQVNIKIEILPATNKTMNQYIEQISQKIKKTYQRSCCSSA